MLHDDKTNNGLFRVVFTITNAKALVVVSQRNITVSKGTSKGQVIPTVRSGEDTGSVVIELLLFLQVQFSDSLFWKNL